MLPRLAAGAETPPEAAAAVRKAVAFLKPAAVASRDNGRGVLAAYALVKAGEPATSDEIRGVLAAVHGRCSGKEYQPASDHYYVAGLELMLLADVDPAGSREDMRKILAYVLKGQQDYGAWYYPSQGGFGDTSITQYATLGLWAAERAGLDVPRSAWDRLAAWHVATQLPDGGFSYHPGPGGGGGLPTMTAAGAANLLLAGRYLYGSTPTPKAVPATEKRYGVLERIDLDRPEAGAPRPAADGPVKTSRGAIEKAAERAVNASAQMFAPQPNTSWPFYYLYGIERMAALADRPALGSHDWYAEGTAHLVKTQQADGSWTGDGSGPEASAAFGVLFLVRATRKTLGIVSEPGLAGGLLAGGRGLPGDLSTLGMQDGELAAREPAGPLDELLGRLEGATGADVPEVQRAVLEAVRFGDRGKLIGERDRLLKLVNHPQPEVRRTAYWALGRGGELRNAAALIRGLSDADPAVAAEAHNALCVLSRRPNAFDLPPDPSAGLPDRATAADREQAFVAWRKRAVAAWSDWYRRVAPYDERDGFGPLK